MKSPVEDRLNHILQAIDRIERICAERTVDDLSADLTMQPAVLYLLGVVSEASRHIPSELKAQAPQIPWRQVADLGNVLRHMYDQVNAEMIWKVVQRDMPVLKNAIEQFINKT